MAFNLEHRVSSSSAPSLRGPTVPQDRPPTVSVVDRSDRSEGRALWPVYREVFGGCGPFPQGAADEEWRDHVWDRLRTRRGFRLARAHAHGRLVGFAYGCTGRFLVDEGPRETPPGRRAEPFEVVRLGVLPAHRGHGVGAALVAAVTEHLPHEHWVLETPAGREDPGLGFWSALGWEVLGAGSRPGTVRMGRATLSPEK